MQCLEVGAPSTTLQLEIKGETEVKTCWPENGDKYIVHIIFSGFMLTTVTSDFWYFTAASTPQLEFKGETEVKMFCWLENMGNMHIYFRVYINQQFLVFYQLRIRSASTGTVPFIKLKKDTKRQLNSEK